MRSPDRYRPRYTMHGSPHLPIPVLLHKGEPVQPAAPRMHLLSVLPQSASYRHWILPSPMLLRSPLRQMDRTAALYSDGIPPSAPPSFRPVRWQRPVSCHTAHLLISSLSTSGASTASTLSLSQSDLPYLLKGPLSKTKRSSPGRIFESPLMNEMPSSIPPLSQCKSLC